MASKTMHKTLLDLETRYWDALKDKDVEAALELTADPCVIVGAQGVGRVDTSMYRQMMSDATWTIVDFKIGDDVQVEMLAQVGGPGDPHLGGGDQDVHLAHLEVEGAQGVVVEVGHDPVEQPQAHGDARPGDRVDAAARRFVHDRAAPSPSRLLYMQVSAGVKGVL